MSDARDGALTPWQALPARVAWTVIVVVDVAGLALNVARRLRAIEEGFAGDLFLPVALALVSAAFATVGLLVATRRPGNAVVWPLYVLGFALAAVVVAEATVGSGANVWLTWVASWAIDPAMFAGLIFLLLLFPNGRLPSPRWRPVSWFAVACLAGLVLVYAFDPGPLRSDERLANPLPVQSLDGLLSAAEHPLFVAMLAALLASACALGVRYRGAGTEQRQQLKWLAAAGIILGLAFLAGPVVWFSELPEVAWHLLFVVGLGSFPIAAGIAILRYRLYEIDRIISRTLSYALVTAVLGGLYILGVLLLGQLLAPLGPDPQLAVAAAFGPVRRRVQDTVDRRFNRARYDAQQTVAAFSARLREEVDIDDLRTDLLTAVVGAFEPAHASLWLRSATVGKR